MSNTNNIIDLTGMVCPLPLLKTKFLLAQLESGSLLEVVTTDPSSWEDFKAYSRISGNKLIESKRCKMKFIFKIEKK